jgi:RNA polymerase sigma factor (sigma-70 family)
MDCKKEADYSSFYYVLEAIVIGEESIDVILAHAEFRKRTERICKALARNFRLKIEADDLFQEVCLKVLKYGRAIGERNIRNEGAFFSWLYVVAQNICRSELRKRQVLLSDIAFDDLQIADRSINLLDDQLLKEFREFSKHLPDREHWERRAIDLWLEGYSYRDIKKLLGIAKSHVAISNRIKKAIEKFSAIKGPAVSRTTEKKDVQVKSRA